MFIRCLSYNKKGGDLVFENLRNELYDFYLQGDAERARTFANKCFTIMEQRYRSEMTITEQKLLQYDVITEEFDPKVFRYTPFFYETGVLTSLSDGVQRGTDLRRQTVGFTEETSICSSIRIPTCLSSREFRRRSSSI